MIKYWKFKEQDLQGLLYAIEEISEREFKFHIKYQNGQEYTDGQIYPERQQAYDAAVEKARGPDNE